MPGLLCCTSLSWLYFQASLSIRGEDLSSALHSVVPSSQRASDVLVHFRPVLWSDIGGLADVKAQVKQVRHGHTCHYKLFKTTSACSSHKLADFKSS